MNFRTLVSLVSLAAFPGPALLAQSPLGGNLLYHYDGTTEATSRGGVAGTDEVSVLQRFPWDQCCGRTRLCCIQYTMQDQDPTTVESYTLEVRRSNPPTAAFPFGSPDMSPAGVIRSYPMRYDYGVIARRIALEIMPCIPLPELVGVPAADFYIGLRFAPNPNWPASDGVSCHTSGRLLGNVGEQFNALHPARYAMAPSVGLAFLHNWTTGVTSLASGDRAWAISAGLYEDVCQPVAFNPSRFTGTGGTGLDPNFGYAGIFPDVAQGDAVGWRVRSVVPPGNPCVLLVGYQRPVLLNLAMFGITGTLCVEHVVSIIQPTRPEALCRTQSSALFGGFAFPATLRGMSIMAQALTLDAAALQWHVSTACTTAF